MANGCGPQEERPNESTEEPDSVKDPDDESVAGNCLEEKVVADDGGPTQYSIDIETELDYSVLQYFEIEFSSQVPDQLSVDSCYGRGKGLADITLPRLPKKLQDDSCLGSSTRSDNVDQLVLQSQMNRELNPGCGRGKMLEMQFNCLGEKEVRPGQKAAEESPQVASPAKSSGSIYDDNFDFDSIYYTKPAKPKSYNVKCLEEFPSLAQQSSAESKSAEMLCNSTKTNKQVRQRSHQNVFKPTEAFEDAEESELDATHYKSQTLNAPFQKVETSDGAYSSLSETMFNQEMRDKQGQNYATSVNAVESTLDVNCHNSQAFRKLETHKDEACDSVQKLCHSDLKYDSCQNDLNPDHAMEISEDLACDVTGHNSHTSNITSQREEASYSTGDADNTCSSNIPSEADKVSQEACGLATVADVQTSSSMASAGVAEDKHNKEDASQCAENLDSSQASDRASGAENRVACKPKKKPAGAWKLEGPDVVQVENVPKGSGEELKMHLAVFGKIVDQEKKSQKRANIWRFRFEDADKCDYAVSCIDGFDLFEGSLPPLACHHLGQTQEDEM